MSVRGPAAGDAMWSFDVEDFERKIAVFLKNNSITTNAGRAAFVADTAASFTPALQLQFLQALANCFKSSLG